MAASIVEFCDFLRTHGVSSDLRRMLVALETAKAIGVENQQFFAFALQTALCSTREEWDLFPQLFEQFWGEPQPGPRRPSIAEKKQSRSDTRSQRADSAMFLDQYGSEAEPQSRDGRPGYGASAEQRLKKMDFSEVPYDDLESLEKLSLRLLHRMSLKLSRRLTIVNPADRVDLRRSIRRSIPYGGEPIALAYKGRRPRKNKLVIFLDISGSMNLYSLFLVRFAYALQSCFRRTNTFLFSTHVVEISDLFRNRHLSEALRRLSLRAAGWSGGTRIGESLQQFNRLYGNRLLSRDTVFIVLSDGWDTGEPGVLATQMRVIRRHVQKVLWLNPLLGLKDYQPVTRGMAAALPYVDVFAPAHNLESLIALERYL
jgi:uncharacterized protein